LIGSTEKARPLAEVIGSSRLTQARPRTGRDELGFFASAQLLEPGNQSLEYSFHGVRVRRLQLQRPKVLGLGAGLVADPLENVGGEDMTPGVVRKPIQERACRYNGFVMPTGFGQDHDAIAEECLRVSERGESIAVLDRVAHATRPRQFEAEVQQPPRDIVPGTFLEDIEAAWLVSDPGPQLSRKTRRVVEAGFFHPARTHDPLPQGYDLIQLHGTIAPNERDLESESYTARCL